MCEGIAEEEAICGGAEEAICHLPNQFGHVHDTDKAEQRKIEPTGIDEKYIKLIDD